MRRGEEEVEEGEVRRDTQREEGRVGTRKIRVASAKEVAEKSPQSPSCKS